MSGAIMNNTPRLQGRSAVVLCGHTADADGLGPGLAQRLRDEGAQVALLAAEDLADAPALQQALDAAVARQGGLDILLNVPFDAEAPKATAALSEADWAAAHRSAFDQPRWAMQAALPHLQRGGGCIVNVVSQYGDSVWRGVAAYNAACEALKGLTRSAAEEWGVHGIRVNALVPAAAAAPFTALAATKPEAVAQLLATVPLRRMGDVQRDIGGALMLLVGDAGRYLTGHIVHADGGQHLAPSPYEAAVLA
jgi:NAD(P)-dependent dehydrogenase (short-subunit alcohol dehydrogenase family)